METVDRDRVAEKLGELNFYWYPKISYRLETMFPRIDGFFINVQIRDKVDLVRHLEPLLGMMLLKKEVVLFLSKGSQSTLSDVFLMGSLWAESTLHTVIVFTNLRVFCIRTDRMGIPHKTFWSIYYSQIDEIVSTILGYTKICLKDGNNLWFSGFNKEAQQSMQCLVEEIGLEYRDKGFDPAVTQSQEQLCGHCFSVIPPNIYQCECCRATYWTPSEVGIRSFIFPSWGDIVMRHYALACAEFCGFLLLVLLTLIAFSEGKYFTGLAIFFIANLADAALSVQIATKGLHLKKIPKK
ncbi:hypothetical protein [Gimesia aquarii]|uniref:YokE-like PH domain-containing protein n=1 Tax=Gimesia aquarii TaxID=2527964 RepID=A0A517VZ39_9PLAN|nr:hypothetical protein [Gimesia aquarii]QDT98240.1 hypothetical protein V144x_37260 [Gimesia aquarii]